MLASLNSVLAEPIADLLLTDAPAAVHRDDDHGDLEQALKMPGGNIFHGPLSGRSPKTTSRSTRPPSAGVSPPGTPGAAVRIGARRGGAVSGLGGHNAAMAVLES